MSTYLTDEDKAGLFEKAMLCDEPDCELCQQAVPFVEELIRRHRKEAWDAAHYEMHGSETAICFCINPYEEEEDTPPGPAGG